MTADPVEPVDRRDDGSDDRSGDGGATVGTVGEELARLLQLVAERSSMSHPVVTLVREHPELVEQVAETVVGWVREAQDTLSEAVAGTSR
ncbi:hypothetical protein ACHAAC_04670 [Aeromicrobium sp. CF4.19]|uniref:hypothetical protein n=1 Tax=Aeromicrobium sp. CF4.19 TaxID=3373082 RepID=UPI003EE434FB